MTYQPRLVHLFFSYVHKWLKSEGRWSAFWAVALRMKGERNELKLHGGRKSDRGEVSQFHAENERFGVKDRGEGAAVLYCLKLMQTKRESCLW